MEYGRSKYLLKIYFRGSEWTENPWLSSTWIYKHKKISFKTSHHAPIYKTIVM